MKSLQSLSYKTLFAIFFFAVAGIIFFLKIGGKTTKVSAAWWDESWHYRKSISVNNTGSNQSNVYLTLSIDTTDTTKFQTDCGDLRFTNQNGSLLNYYIVSGCGTATTSVHINFPTLISGSSNFYLYYGNTSANNGFSTSDFFTAATNSTPSLQSEETGGGPIAYWKFDEGSGSTAYDSAGSNNGTFGTGSSAPTWANESQCISGKCLSFDGTQSVNSNYDASWNNTNKISINFWVKPQNITDIQTGIIGKQHSLYEWSFYQNGNSVSLVYWDTSGSHTNGMDDSWGSVLIANKWTNLAYTWDGSTSKFYADGKLVKTKTATNPSINMNRTNNMMFGGNIYTWGDKYFKGSIDEVKIYPYARTADQIKLDYNSRGSLSGSSANLGVQSNTAPSLKSSLVAYYKFDENSGTIVHDSSGNNLNGNFIGTTYPTWSNNGKTNKALSFDGITNTVSTPHNSILNIGTGSYSVFSWVKLSASTGSHDIIVDKGGANINDGGFWWGMTTNGKQDANINIGSSFLFTNQTSNSRIDDNNWHRVGFTWDPTIGLKFWLDGKIDGSVNATTTANIQGTSSLYIGGYSNFSGFSSNGLIDEVKIYNKALTADEVKQDYNQGSAISFGQTTQNIGGTTTSLDYCIPGDTSYCVPPVAEYKFDEGIGTSIIDTSGNNLNGSLAGNPVWVGQCHTGSCLTLDHIDDRMTVNHSSILEPASITIGGWVKLNNISNRHVLFTKWNGYSIEVNSSGYPYFRTYNGSQQDLTSSKNIVWNKWHYISATFDDVTKQKNIYLDGINVGSTTTSNSIIYNQGIFAIPYSSGGMASGFVDQVRLYNYARTPAQIAYDYNKGAPVAWWKMDECQGSTVYDWSGNQNNGTITIGASGTQNSLGTCQVGTSAAWTNGASGKINSSLNFDGTDDYVSMPFSFIQNKFSVSWWLYPTSLSNFNQAIGSINGQTNYGWNYFCFHVTSTGAVYTGTDVSTRLTPTELPANTVQLNTWQHFTFTFDNGTGKFYKNGILLATKTGMYVPTTDFGGFRTWTTNGKLDDFRVYNYTLTAEQVKQVYNGGAVNFQ